MTRDEARQVLMLYRPWAKDSPSPEISAALELVPQDAELREWFESYGALQATVHDSIWKQSAPEAFREQIVSECLARKRARSRRNVLAAGVTILLIALGLEAFWLFGERRTAEEISFAAYERRMSREALRLYRMDLETADLEAIQTFLSARNSPTNYALPPAVKSFKATGCLATQWQGRPVSMICFHTGKPLPAGRTSDLFLFVIAKDAVPGAPVERTPTFAQMNRLTVAHWSSESMTYILATEHGEEYLRGIL